MKRFWTRALGWLGRRLFAQLHTQLSEINERLGTVSARLEDVQAVVEASCGSCRHLDRADPRGRGVRRSNGKEVRGDRADARGGTARESLTVRLAIDLQALQIDGYADRGIGRYIAGNTAALARAGRVAAGLLAPELPPPAGLPPELATAGLARWDSMEEMRRLLADGGPVAHHVPAPFLHTGPTDPSVLVVVPHWADAGVARVVTVHDLIPLRHPGQYLPSAGTSSALPGPGGVGGRGRPDSHQLRVHAPRNHRTARL